MEGKINLRLRPIRFCFFINSSKRSEILEAIQINSFLWGGRFNPIIPITNQIPKVWKKSIFRQNMQNIIEGYIDAYDPDYIVKFGDINTQKYKLGERKIIDSKEVLGVETSHYPKVGIGIFELLNQIYEDEFKYLRKIPYEVSIPQISSEDELFLSAVFGNIKRGTKDEIIKFFNKRLEIETKECNINNFSNFLKVNKLFLRRIGESYIQHVRNVQSFRNDYVIILNSKNNYDIIDYWNLRAAGVRILPLPVQCFPENDIYSQVSDFINSNYYPINQNNVYNQTIILKGRSVNGKVFEKIINSLKNQNDNQTIGHKFLIQSFHPRIWNNFGRRADHVGYCDIESISKEINVSSENNYISVNTLPPQFSTNNFSELGLYINEVELKFNREDSSLYAQAIPEAGEELVHSFKTWSYDQWRFSRYGVFFKIKNTGYDTISFNAPKSEDVFIDWFKYNGLKIKLSNSGIIAKQIIKHLGSIHNLQTLVNEEIIKLLIRFVKKRDTISFSELIHILKKGKDKGDFHLGHISNTLNRLLDLKILKLGVRIQCSNCKQFQWYSLTDLDDRINCPICFTKFPFPSSEPNKLKWEYKPIGPFSLQRDHIGVYCSLLCLSFFNRHGLRATTNMLSFDIVGHCEVDLGMIRGKTFKDSEPQEVIFFECKTLNEFERKDIQRMHFVASKFPGSVIVFATLKDKLSLKERKLLIPFVKKSRKYWKEDRPINPVLILTRNELFSYWGPPLCWKGLGGNFTKFEDSHINVLGDLLNFCDVSQQIYLDMESWHTWITKQFEKKFSK